MRYRVNNFEIDATLFKIVSDGVTVPTEPKVFDLIIYLIEKRDQVVSRDQLLNDIWNGREVSDTTLSNHIKSARRVFGDNGELQNIISTVRGRGYQFVAMVEELIDDDKVNNVGITAEQSTQQQKSAPSRIYHILAVLILAVTGIFLTTQFISSTADDEFTRRLAVLPFTNLKPDTKTDYMGFALADQVIGGLTNLDKVAVRASGSVRHYQQLTLEPAIIGKELNVDYLLMGSYLNEAGRLKLTIELVELKNNEMIWRKSIQGSVSNAYSIQAELVESVAANLGLEYSNSKNALIKGDVPKSPLAYEYYLRAIAFPHTREGRDMAIKMLRQAEAIDSTFAPLYVELGDRTRFKSLFELGADAVAHESNEYYRKAIELNPHSFAAKAGLADYLTERGQLFEAVKIVREILAQQPNNAEAHFSLSYIYRYAGFGDESIKEMKTAISIDPKERWVHNLGITYMYFGHYQKALEELNKGKPTPYSLALLATTYFQLGEEQKTLEYLEKVLAMEPGEFWVLDAKGHRAGINKEYAVGLDAIKKYEDSNIKHGESLFHWAGLAALLGDNETCFRLLKKSLDAGHFNYPLYNNSALLASVRDEGEFKEILALVKTRHEDFKAQYF